MGRKAATAASPGTSPRGRKKAGGKPAKATEIKTATVEIPRLRSSFHVCASAIFKFVAIALASLAISTVLFSLSVPIMQGDLAWTSKHLESWWYVAGLLGYRVLELAVPWVLGYDARDVACLITLIHIPTYSLLHNFYGIRPTTILTAATITLLSTTLPFLYFRRFNALDLKPSTPHRSILLDRPTMIYTIVGAAGVYTAALHLGFATCLPAFLVSHFDGLPDISKAYEGTKGFISMLLGLLPAGYAARQFLFVSSLGRPSADEVGPEYKSEKGEFLVTTVYRKYWLTLPEKTRSLLSRTFVLASMVVVNTVVQLVATINGAEFEGALGWAAVWGIPTILNGLMYAWIQAADGV